jgi:hypothetical protein
MDNVHAFCPPFGESTKLGKPTATHYGGWLPWPLYYVEEDSEGWFVAKRQSKVLWHDPWAGYALPRGKRRQEKRPSHIRFGEEATSQEGALQFSRQFGFPDLPPFHALADTFDAWGDGPGWEEPQRQTWLNLRNDVYAWSWLGFACTVLLELEPVALAQAPVLVAGQWVRSVARLQASLNELAEAVSLAVSPAELRRVLEESGKPVEATPAAEADLRDAWRALREAMVSLLEWAEPHWFAIRDERSGLHFRLLPARQSDLRTVLEHDEFRFGTEGKLASTCEGVWRWLRDSSLLLPSYGNHVFVRFGEQQGGNDPPLRGMRAFRTGPELRESDVLRLVQGGALAPPYLGGQAKARERRIAENRWPDCSELAQTLAAFARSEHQILRWRCRPHEMDHRSYLQHAAYIFARFTVWDRPEMALPTPKPYLSLRHALLGMVSRDAFGGWWVRCGDLERCGKPLFAPSEGRWYHKNLGCGPVRRTREAKRRVRGKV